MVALWRDGDVLEVLDGDVIQCAVAVGLRMAGSLGLWLRCGEDYPAPLVARDVASVAHLVDVDRVVVDASTHPREHAEIVRAMLENDCVTLANAAGFVRDARNRPQPPAPIEVLAYVEPYLEGGQRRLKARARVALGRLSIEQFA